MAAGLDLGKVQKLVRQADPVAEQLDTMPLQAVPPSQGSQTLDHQLMPDMPASAQVIMFQVKDQEHTPVVVVVAPAVPLTDVIRVLVLVVVFQALL